MQGRVRQNETVEVRAGRGLGKRDEIRGLAGVGWSSPNIGKSQTERWIFLGKVSVLQWTSNGR